VYKHVQSKYFYQFLKPMRISTKQGIAPIIAIIIALLALGGGAYGIKKITDGKKEKKAKEEQVAKEEQQKEENDKKEEEKAEKQIPSTLQIRLDEQNASGQSGQAVITQIGTSTLKVIVNLTGKPSGVSQPAHIHLGSCPTPGAVKYPLTNVDKGASQTEIQNLTMAELLAGVPLAINVHKSGADIKTYVSCGNIVLEKETAENEGGAKNSMKSEDKKDGMKTSGKGGAMMGAGVQVVYTATGFAPQTVTIKKGDTVTFENKTGKRASVASNNHPTHLIYPEFDQYKTDQRGKDEFTFTFTKVGTWGYHDHLNASMGGTVVVTE